VSNAGTEALYRAAQYIASAVRHAAPSARTAASWVLRRRGDSVVIHTDYIAEYMSETGRRHPVWARGPRSDWAWAAQNEHHPERTHAAERAMYRAADRAGDLFLDSYLERIAIDSPYFNRGY
jgi:hypothetical protein